MPRRLWCICLAAIGLASAAPARAGLVVSFNAPQPILAGGTGELDVYLGSTASSTSPDMINNFGFTLQFTGPGPGFLQFSPTQNFAYLNDPTYVYQGDSADFDVMPGPPIGGFTGTTTLPNDTFTGFDSTTSGIPVSLSTTQTFLLARLTVDASSAIAGDLYTVNLVPTTGTGSFLASQSTYFDVVDSNFDETSYTSFESEPFDVPIATAVPEPASVMLVLTGLVPLAVRRLRKSKSA